MLIDIQQRRIYPAKWHVTYNYGKRQYFLRDYTREVIRMLKRNGIKFLEGREGKGADRTYITMSTKDFFTIKDLLYEKEN